MEISTTTPVTYRASAARPGPAGLLAEAIRETWSRRRLVRYLVQADLKKTGADSLLGNVWWVLDPLLQMLVYVILVSVILRQSLPDYPLFIFAAILPWKWFTSSVNDAIASVTSQERLIKQVQFPKIVLPTAAMSAAVANFLFGLVPLAGLLVIFYHDRLSALLVLVIPIAVVQFVFSLAFGYVVAGVNVFFRDVANISRHALRLWFYLSPGLYPPSSLARIAESHPTIAQLMTLNPFYTLFDSYRAVIYGSTDAGVGPHQPDWAALGIVLAASLAFLAVATIFFKRLEPSFAKVL